MITISKWYTGEAAHKLGEGYPDPEGTFGKCSRLHGHSYKMKVVVQSKSNTLKNGMVLNYFELDDIVKPMVDNYLDHRYLNDIFPHLQPTSENLARAFATLISSALPVGIQLVELILKETDKTEAIWTL